VEVQAVQEILFVGREENQGDAWESLEVKV
jgi:hypothetical protein